MKELIILNCIPKDHYITRQELSHITGFSDRLVRASIEQCRKQGYHIVSSDHQKGYKLAESEQEINKLLTVYKSRIKTEIQTLIALSDEAEVIDWLMDTVNRTEYTC